MTRAIRTASLLLSLALVSPVDASAGCPCDCSGDGAVTVNELVAAVAIALGDSPATACAAADGDGDTAVAIGELIAGVNAALVGCPPAEGGPAAAALALARAATHLYVLGEPLFIGFNGLVYGAGDCEGGGAIDVACADSGGGVARVEIAAAPCTELSAEGPHIHDGTVAVTFDGACPNVIDDPSPRFAVDLRTVAEPQPEGPTLTIVQALAATLEALDIGPAPCAVKGGRTAVSGQVDAQFADGARMTAGLDDTVVAVGFFDFINTCDPARLTVSIDGPLATGVAAGTVAALADLDAVVELVARTASITGAVTLADGTVLTLSTPMPLGFPFAGSCFTAGTLRVSAGEQVRELTFTGGGEVAIDDDGDGAADRVDPNCLYGG